MFAHVMLFSSSSWKHLTAYSIHSNTRDSTNSAYSSMTHGSPSWDILEVHHKDSFVVLFPGTWKKVGEEPIFFDCLWTRLTVL